MSGRAQRAARVASTLLVALVAVWGPGCNKEQSPLRAKQIENRFELVGGPVGMADVGDFLLENDQIRVAILGARPSPGPGVFGGALVDADLRRPFLPTAEGQGRDRFAETFPLANLLVPNPTSTQVFVLADGSDGKEAIVRVEGVGDFFFEAIGFLDTSADLLSLLFGELKTAMRFRTDYILAPGDRFVKIRTLLVLDDPNSTADAKCDGSLDGCELECDTGLALDADGCLTCACDEPIPLDNYQESTPIFRGILGDPLINLGDPNFQEPELEAGIVAGDFVFFGNQNDIFGPGFGFDEEKAIFDAIFAGRDTFQQPLAFDFVAASGGDVSYAYFTKGTDGEARSVVNVPIFTSAATAFLSAVKNCRIVGDDDLLCDNKRSFTFERYLAIGDGDIASAAEIVFEERETPTGTVQGAVRWADTGEGVPFSRVFLFSNPDPERKWGSLDELVDANIDLTGTQGLVNTIFADRGIDRVLDGAFRASVQAGEYVVFGRTADGMAVSDPIPISVKSGGSVTIAPMLEPPATVVFRVTDETGLALPSKLVFQGLDDDGEPLILDGKRRVYMGDSRFGNGIRHVEYSQSGAGELQIEPGRYRVFITRGFEYSRHEITELTLASGQRHTLDATLVREVNTAGWASIDMHLHATPSFDSGMPLDQRVRSAVVEGLDMAVATDHDVLTDYSPTVRELALEPWLQTVVGAEVSSLELGHYIGWPMQYDFLDVPDHGVYDWTCHTGNEILEGVESTGVPGKDFLTILAHPRDGFIGYIDQLGVDPFTLKRSPAFLNASNALFRTATCDFEAMEVYNSKRLDLVRTPTVREVVTFNLCLDRVDASTTESELEAACPELEGWPLTQCKGERFSECQHRHRSALAWEVTKQILVRTPEEQAELTQFALTAAEGEEFCKPALWEARTDEEKALWANRPCTNYSGHLDDFMQFAEHGYAPTQVGSSDGHGTQREPGTPRTYFRSSTDTPGAIDEGEAVRSLEQGKAVATYGPFIDAEIDGAGVGEVARATAGDTVSLRVRVETPSWFGVERVEVYMNRELVRVLEPNAAPGKIVDVDERIELTVPDRDSWVLVVAMGLGDQHLLGPSILNVPFGELQLPRVASLALTQLGPIAESFISPSPPIPDWFPIPPLAMTNPIYIDTDGNGAYDSPFGLPEFCSAPCGPSVACPEGQTCLAEGLCGLDIEGTCGDRVFLPQTLPDGDAGR